MNAGCIQLFQERLSEKVHKTIQRCGTIKDNQKVWVILSLMFFREISKNCTRSHGRMIASAKRKQQKYIRQLQFQEKCIDHIPHYLSGLSCTQFFRQPFSKQLYELCISACIIGISRLLLQVSLVACNSKVNLPR